MLGGAPARLGVTRALGRQGWEVRPRGCCCGSSVRRCGGTCRGPSMLGGPGVSRCRDRCEQQRFVRVAGGCFDESLRFVGRQRSRRSGDAWGCFVVDPRWGELGEAGRVPAALAPAHAPTEDLRQRVAHSSDDRARVPLAGSVDEQAVHIVRCQCPQLSIAQSRDDVVSDRVLVRLPHRRPFGVPRTDCSVEPAGGELADGLGSRCRARASVVLLAERSKLRCDIGLGPPNDLAT